MNWLEVYLEMYWGDIQLSVLKLCNMYGIGELYDDVFAETMLVVCEKASNYNPKLSAFSTWTIGHAKNVARRMIEPSKHIRYGGAMSANVHLRYEYMFAELPTMFDDDYSDDPGVTRSPIVYDTYNLDGLDPRFISFIQSLSIKERLCLSVLLIRQKTPTYRELGVDMGVSHTHAGKVLKQLRQKARCLQN